MQDVDSLLATIPEPRQAAMRHYHQLIVKAAPQLTVEVAGAMIGYGPYHYKYESGREGDTYIVMLANRKAYISLYVLAVKNGMYLAETYASQLAGTNVGKSCINIKKPEVLDDTVVAKLVAEAADIMWQSDMSDIS